MGLIGAHCSIAGGLYRSVEVGDQIGCESIQIFLGSSRTWQLPQPSPEDILKFKQALAQAKHVRKAVAHNSYLLNLSTANSVLRKKSVRYFIHCLELCEELGLVGLITHPGSHLGAGIDSGIAMTAKSISEVQKACPNFSTRIILENTAGQGGGVGALFEELKQIVDQVSHPELIRFCLDTQHAFAAGYDHRTLSGYNALLSKWDKLLSLSNIIAFHLNDALKDLGTRVDRHANIGTGFIGKSLFHRLVTDSRFTQIPMCLETDPGPELKNYRREIRMLKGFRVKQPPQ